MTDVLSHMAPIITKGYTGTVDYFEKDGAHSDGEV